MKLLKALDTEEAKQEQTIKTATNNLQKKILAAKRGKMHVEIEVEIFSSPKCSCFHIVITRLAFSLGVVTDLFQHYQCHHQHHLFPFVE